MSLAGTHRPTRPKASDRFTNDPDMNTSRMPPSPPTDDRRPRPRAASRRPPSNTQGWPVRLPGLTRLEAAARRHPPRRGDAPTWLPSRRHTATAATPARPPSHPASTPTTTARGPDHDDPPARKWRPERNPSGGGASGGSILPEHGASCWRCAPAGWRSAWSTPCRCRCAAGCCSPPSTRSARTRRRSRPYFAQYGPSSRQSTPSASTVASPPMTTIPPPLPSESRFRLTCG